MTDRVLSVHCNFYFILDLFAIKIIHILVNAETFSDCLRLYMQEPINAVKTADGRE